MKLASIRYLAGEGFKNTWVNRLMTVASIGVLMACMILIGLALVFSENISLALGRLEQQNVVMVYMKDYSWALYDGGAEDTSSDGEQPENAESAENAESVENAENAENDENYYVYIKVIPNLSVFGYSIEHLTTYMPCFMYFSIGASFDTSVTYQSESASESLSEIVAP